MKKLDGRSFGKGGRKKSCLDKETVPFGERTQDGSIAGDCQVEKMGGRQGSTPLRLFLAEDVMGGKTPGYCQVLWVRK